jgi:hypothetical protein
MADTTDTTWRVIGRAHRCCADCDNCAQSALSNARCMGSVAARYERDGHYAQVSDRRCARWHNDTLCRCRVSGQHTCGPGYCRACGNGTREG